MSDQVPETTTPPAPAPSTPYVMPDDLRQIVEQALAAQRAQFDEQQNLLKQQQVAFDAQTKAMQDQITALQSALHGSVVTMLAEHAAGPGTETAETWSQFEQERSWLAKERALSGAL